MKTHICPTYCYLFLTTLLFYPSLSFKTCSIIELSMILWNIFNNLYWLCHICVYMYICVGVYIYICIYSFNIVAYIIKLFMFSVYMYISALHILFAPGSYTSHWLMFLLLIRLEIKLILSYLISNSSTIHVRCSLGYYMVSIPTLLRISMHRGHVLVVCLNACILYLITHEMYFIWSHLFAESYDSNSDINDPFGKWSCKF